MADSGNSSSGGARGPIYSSGDKRMRVVDDTSPSSSSIAIPLDLFDLPLSASSGHNAKSSTISLPWMHQRAAFLQRLHQLRLPGAASSSLCQMVDTNSAASTAVHVSSQPIIDTTSSSISFPAVAAIDRRCYLLALPDALICAKIFAYLNPTNELLRCVYLVNRRCMWLVSNPLCVPKWNQWWWKPMSSIGILAPYWLIKPSTVAITYTNGSDPISYFHEWCSLISSLPSSCHRIRTFYICDINPPDFIRYSHVWSSLATSLRSLTLFAGEPFPLHVLPLFTSLTSLNITKNSFLLVTDDKNNNKTVTLTDAATMREKSTIIRLPAALRTMRLRRKQDDGGLTVAWPRVTLDVQDCSNLEVLVVDGFLVANQHALTSLHSFHSTLVSSLHTPSWISSYRAPSNLIRYALFAMKYTVWVRQTNNLTITADNIARGTRLQHLELSCVTVDTVISIFPHVPNLTTLGVHIAKWSLFRTDATRLVDHVRQQLTHLRIFGMHDLDQLVEFVAHDCDRDILEVSLEKDSSDNGNGGISLPYMAEFGWSASLKHTGKISLRRLGIRPICGRFKEQSSTVVALAPLRVNHDNEPDKCIIHNQLMMAIIATVQRGITMIDTPSIESHTDGNECAYMRTIIRPFPAAATAMATRAQSITVASLLDHL